MNPHSVFSIQLNKARVVAILTPHFRRAPLLFYGPFCVDKFPGVGIVPEMKQGARIVVIKTVPATRLPHPNQCSRLEPIRNLLTSSKSNLCRNPRANPRLIARNGRPPVKTATNC
jgi:hypothetical protein